MEGKWKSVLLATYEDVESGKFFLTD